MQFQADLLGVPVDRPTVIETTAAGAAFLAGLGVGLWKDAATRGGRKVRDRVFQPEMGPARREALEPRAGRPPSSASAAPPDPRPVGEPQPIPATSRSTS